MSYGIKNTILVLSGKGGVGKSTVTVQLANAFKKNGRKVGILDIDLCGPSIPRMVGVENCDVLVAQDGRWIPVYTDESKSLGIISLGFFISSKTDAVIWRGPKKNAMIKQLLSNVVWDVDYLIIDTPPGTSDEHITIMENVREMPIFGAVLVTTPQLLSIEDVNRELTFCRKASVPILGIIENMSGYICQNCKECTNIFASGGGESLAKKENVAFLGRIPIDIDLVKCTENGINFVENQNNSVSSLFLDIANKLTL